MKLILILVSLFCFENCIVSALRFDIRNPITVDHPDGVIEIGRPTKFTCAYMTSRSDRVNAIRWYISYKNSNDNYGNVSITALISIRPIHHFQLFLFLMAISVIKVGGQWKPLL